MSIASRIEAIEQHLTDDYSVLTLAGADLTNVDKNILNLKPTWKERLLYFMNNGTDVVWNNWDKVTGEGTSISLNNTLEGKMKINLKGNTSQESTTGANILPQDKYVATRTENGVTFTNNGDGTFSLTGTATADTAIHIIAIGNIELVANQAYYLYSSEPYNGVTFNLSIPMKDGGTTKIMNANSTYTPTTTPTNVRLQFFIANGKTVNAQKVKVMLVKGTIAPTDYEPYTNGASPNPDYPQDIHVVSGDNSIVVCGKNLFDESVEKKSAYPTTTIGSVVSYVNSGASTSYVNGCYLEAGKTYTFSCKLNTPVSANYRDSVIVDNNNIILEHFYLWENTTSVTYTPSHSGYLVLCVDNNSTELMIEKNNEATTYEAYKGASYPISLGDIELCKIGDYQDKIYKDNGEWYLNKQIGKVVLDGSSDENYSFNSGTTQFYMTKTNFDTITEPRKLSTNALSNYYGFANSWTLNKFSFSGTGALQIWIDDSSITSTALWKTWLSTHNTIVYYVLATPTYTEITDSTLLSQLNALAKSYASQTNISQENNDLESILNATALKEMS